ncbi:SDR family NAD(P)-dependent oxidoreductase [Micromonospora echinospora]|uniref:type I polyketide synthase n=1 Tax=Micromonospora echinospora TaxID=1877 RepID=UPI0037ACAD93
MTDDRRTPARPGQPEPARPDDIAVIGMAGRFPGAADIDQFWRNLSDGVESISRFTEAELLAAGEDPARIADPAYVNARPVLADVADFDAEFFGFGPREATVADPQQRIFLEVAYQALEHGGYGDAAHRGRVGVFAGCNFSTYALSRLTDLRDGLGIDGYEMSVGNDKDALTTMVSYRLNLTGPSVSVQTFCSTSLVAVHLAARSLRDDDCDLALAGGVSIRVPDRVGYRYEEGGMESPDGHVRTFDAAARGTLFGDGAAAVLLKRLDRALADRDPIHAVIRGSAVNNDGARKFGYTAPSLDGQSSVIRAAMTRAGVTASDISYVEAHGTATPLGDPIEVASLTRAFGPGGGTGRCALGSVKTNIGHLDRASGVTGLIKVVHALRERRIPATLHFREPNPEMDLPRTPFRVVTATEPWQAPAGRRRVAGLNSLGMGGTNVHVVVEEPPPVADRPAPARRYQVLPVSARSADAADRACQRLAGHLAARPGLALADVAYTYQVGRPVFAHRRVAVADAASAARQLADVQDLWHRVDTTPDRGVGFLIPGVGEHFEGMAAELYRREPLFRSHLDQCARVLGIDDVVGLLTVEQPTGRAGAGDLARLLGREGPSAPESPLLRAEIAQPVAFVLGYALARTLMDWGVQPEIMLGYSLGEYVAACLAGVLSLPDAVRLVAYRAELIATAPPGAMLAVALTEKELRDRVPDLGDGPVDLAVLTAGATVVAGPVAAVDALADRLRADEVSCRRLDTDHAFHSSLLQPLADQLTDWVRTSVTLRPPQRPYLSNVTGGVATGDLVTDPGYWARHMCAPVRFQDNIAHALAGPELALLELGAGSSLGAMVRAHPDCPAERWPLVVPTLPAAADARADDVVFAEALAKLWLGGVRVDWEAYHRSSGPDWVPGRVPLPGYPFERRRYWLDRATPTVAGPAAGYDPMAALAELPRLPEQQWLNLPVWRGTARLPRAATTGRWLLLRDPGDDPVAARVESALRARGDLVTVVTSGPGARIDPDAPTCTIRPGAAEDVAALLAMLRENHRIPDRVLHLWHLADTSEGTHAEIVRGLHTLAAFARTAGEFGMESWTLDVVTRHTCRVDVDEPVFPGRATVLGICRLLPIEYPGCRTRLVDTSTDERSTDALVAELLADPAEAVVALRRGRRYVLDYDVLLPEPALGVRGSFRHGGVYLVTGGLGGLGLAMAERLAEQYGAQLVLMGRTAPVPESDWDTVLADPTTEPDLRRRLEGLRRLTDLGAEYLLVTGDVANPADVRAAVEAARDTFGALDGVLHAAGVPGVGLMQFKTAPEMDRVLAPKVDGTLALADALRDTATDLLVLFSSTSAITGGGPGQSDYCAANAFLDAFAQSDPLPGTRVVSVNWCEWTYTGWTAGLNGFDTVVREFFEHQRAEFGLSFDDGWNALLRVLDSAEPNVAVSTQDLAAMLVASRRYSIADVETATQSRKTAVGRHPRPDLSARYVEPSSATEQTIADIWAESLGVERVGRHDNFFELGGSSLIAVGIVSRLKRALDTEALTPYVINQCPTVEGLASMVTANAGAGDPDRPGDREPDRQRRRAAQRRDALRRGGRA